MKEPPVIGVPLIAGIISLFAMASLIPLSYSNLCMIVWPVTALLGLIGSLITRPRGKPDWLWWIGLWASGVSLLLFVLLILLLIVCAYAIRNSQ